jgi:hypothetical protein
MQQPMSRRYGERFIETLLCCGGTVCAAIGQTPDGRLSGDCRGAASNSPRYEEFEKRTTGIKRTKESGRKEAQEAQKGHA